MNLKSKRTLTPRLRFPEFKEQWDEVRLSQLANLISDRVGTLACTPYTVTSGLGLVSQEEKYGRTIAGNSLRNYIRLQKDDFAYNKSATKAYPEGYIARYLDKAKAAVPNSIFTCFRVDSEKVDPAYLDFLFAGNLHGRWLRKFLTIGARAHGSLNVSDDDLMALPLPLPSPPEQHKIADCLSSLDGVIAAEERKLTALRDHKRGLMQQLFPQPGQSQPRLRFPEFRDKGEWEECKLGKLVNISSGKSPSQYALSSDGIFPFVKVEDLNNCTKYQVNSREYCDDAGDVVPRQSILFPKRGAAIDLNKIRITAVEILIDTNLMAITPRDTKITEFLFYYLGHVGLSQIADKSTIPQINNKHIIPFNIFVPSRSEQHRVADCLTALDDQITAQAVKIDALKTHKCGLMQQLFPPLEEQV